MKLTVPCIPPCFNGRNYDSGEILNCREPEKELDATSYAAIKLPAEPWCFAC
ncbi:MAG: hypothetical protein ACLT8C_10035 [Akkermansia muciniphila]